MSGYLNKLNRHGKWQRRFFECDGECLTYYKSAKRTRLLATLDLAKVGSIAVSYVDVAAFHIMISNRPYILLAQSKEVCREWVGALNQTKADSLATIYRSSQQQQQQQQFGEWEWNCQQIHEETSCCYYGDIEKDEQEGEDEGRVGGLMLTATTDTLETEPSPLQSPSEHAYSSLRYSPSASLSPSNRDCIFQQQQQQHHNFAEWQKSPRVVAPSRLRYQHGRAVSFLRNCARSICDAACQNPHDQVVQDAHIYPNKETAQQRMKRFA